MRRLLLALACLGATSVFAQVTVSDLSAKGAKKLAAADIKTLVSGSTMTFTTPAGFEFVLSPTADGSINGNASGSNGSFGVGGTWKVDDGGKYCENVTTPRGGLANCFEVYSLGDKYFFLTAQGKAGPRQIRR